MYFLFSSFCDIQCRKCSLFREVRLRVNRQVVYQKRSNNSRGSSRSQEELRMMYDVPLLTCPELANPSACAWNVASLSLRLLLYLFSRVITASRFSHHHSAREEEVSQIARELRRSRTLKSRELRELQKEKPELTLKSCAAHLRWTTEMMVLAWRFYESAKRESSYWNEV